MTMMLLVAAGCSRDEATLPGGSGNDPTVEPPHFYGMAMLENPAPQTRGVAVNFKVWSRPAAKNSLSVKFLNGTERYQSFVKEVVSEWTKAGGVRFHFVDSDQDALIRVGFDHVPGMVLGAYRYGSSGGDGQTGGTHRAFRPVEAGFRRPETQRCAASIRTGARTGTGIPPSAILTRMGDHRGYGSDRRGND